jgi:hypothetical protein
MARVVQHRSRASKPAPRRYRSEANPFRLALPNQDTPEAINGRLAGELHPGDVNFPSPQSSAAGGLLGADLVALANRREHDALVADALRLRRVQVGNPEARRKLAVAVRRMLELERRA